MSVFCCENDIVEQPGSVASGLCKPNTCREYTNITSCNQLGTTTTLSGQILPRFISCADTDTTITIRQPTDGSGNGILKSGTYVGARNRTVTLEATPNPGFEFVRWTIQYTTTDTQPNELPVFAIVSKPTDNLNNICVPLGESPTSFPYVEYQQLSQVLYTDGTRLFLDKEGTRVAPSSQFFGAGNNTYYFYSGIGVPTIQQCTTTTSGGTSTGGSGGGAVGGVELDLTDGTEPR